MFSKIIISCFVSISMFTTVSIGLPDIYCDPFFETITRFVNGSYFINDEKGNFWIARDDEKVSRNSNRKGNISELRTDANIPMNFNNMAISTFELTFMINFNGKCETGVGEEFYGFCVS